MSNTELKPCPFCGGNAFVFMDEYGKFGIKCKGCGLIFGIEVEDGIELKDGWKAVFDNSGSAREAWNTRKPMERIVEQLSEQLEGPLYLQNCEAEYRQMIAIVQKGGTE